MDEDAVNPPKVHSKIPLGAALYELAERQRRELGPHLEADELVAYHEGELAAAEAERVRDHLALCPECAGLLLDLDAFSAPSPAGAPDLTTAEVESAWRELAPRLAEDPPPVVRLPPRRSSPPPLSWSLAAALFLGMIALSFWLMALRGELRDRSQPRVGEIAYLNPQGEHDRGEQAKPVSHLIALILHPPDATQSFSAFDLELRAPGAAGRVLWELRGVQPEPKLGSFEVALPARSLAPGEYVVRLYGVRAGKRVRLTDYDLTVGER